MSYSFTPSRHSGYARSRDECEYPNLWPIVGWSPALQQQGGQVVKDVSSRYPGTMTAMEVGDWTTFTGWKALACGGTDEYARTTDATLIASCSGCRKYTIATWNWRDGTYVNWKAGFTIPTALRGFEINDLAGTIYLILPVSGGIVYGYVGFTTAGWHHKVLVYDGYQATDASRLKLFVDGVQRTLTFAGTIPAAVDSFTGVGAEFSIGRYYTSFFNYMVGAYGDVLAYPRALHQREVLQLYHLGPGGWATPKKSRGRRVPTAPPAAENNAAWWLAYQMGM